MKPKKIFEDFAFLDFSSFFIFLILIFIFLFFLFFLFFFFVGGFQSSEQTTKPAKNRREVPIVKRTTFFDENLIFGPRWTRHRGLGKAQLRVTWLSCFSLFFSYFHFCLPLRKCFFFSFFVVFLSKSFIAGIDVNFERKMFPP